MKKIIITVVIALTMSCNIGQKEKGENQLSYTGTNETDSVVYYGQNFERKENINISSFHFFADSIVSEILGQQNSFKLITDTIEIAKLSNLERKETIQGYIAERSSITVKHHFKLSSPNSNLSITLYETFFNTKESLDSVFSYLKYLANEDDIDKQVIPYAPGLTYDNDYVARNEKHLVWLNSKCSYSILNHMKFVKALKESMNNKAITDSIICKCGEVDCK